MVNLFERRNLRFHVRASESDEGSLVSHLVAVIWRAENSQHFAALLVLEALWLNLVAPHEQSQPVVLKESLGDVWTEHDADSALRRMSSVGVTWVRPEQLDHDALVARLSLPVLFGDLAELDAIFGEEATVANHDLAVDHMAQRQVAEELREELVGLHVVLGLDFALEAVHLVQLLGLVVAAAHEKVLRVANFPGEHQHDDFDREGAAIDEITVENVWILLRGVPVQLENVHQVVVLAMDVAADRDFLQLVNRHLDKRVKRLENLRRLLNDHSGVLLVEHFSVALVLHERDDPFRGDILDRLQPRPRVRVLHKDLIRVDDNFGFLVDDGLGQELLLVGLECDLVLLSGVAVLRLQLADLLEGQDSLFHLSERDVSLTLSVETFDVLRVEFHGLAGIEQRELVFLHFETREGPIAVKDCLFLG